MRSHGSSTGALPTTMTSTEEITPKGVPDESSGNVARTKPTTTGTAVTTLLRDGKSISASGINTSTTPTAVAPTRASDVATEEKPCSVTKPTIAIPMNG